MGLSMYRREFVCLAKFIGLTYTQNDINGFDCFLPVLNKIKADSSIVVFKIDGEREEDSYTLLISGKKLGDGEYIRIDTSDLEGGLSYICVEYAKRVWGFEVTQIINEQSI